MGSILNNRDYTTTTMQKQNKTKNTHALKKYRQYITYDIQLFLITLF